VPANWAKKVETRKQEPWNKQQVIEGYKSGRFAVHALARLACVRVNQVRVWIDPDWQPLQFNCINCGKFTCTNIKQRAAGDIRCKCGTSWREGFKP
jgi:hypothetical protein